MRLYQKRIPVTEAYPRFCRQRPSSIARDTFSSCLSGIFLVDFCCVILIPFPLFFTYLLHLCSDIPSITGLSSLPLFCAKLYGMLHDSLKFTHDFGFLFWLLLLSTFIVGVHDFLFGFFITVFCTFPTILFYLIISQNNRHRSNKRKKRRKKNLNEVFILRFIIVSLSISCV